MFHGGASKELRGDSIPGTSASAGEPFKEHVLLTGVRKEHFLPLRKWHVELWFFERELSKAPVRNTLCILT